MVPQPHAFPDLQSYLKFRERASAFLGALRFERVAGDGVSGAAGGIYEIRKPRVNAVAIIRHLTRDHDDLYAAQVSKFTKKVRCRQLVHGEIVELNYRDRAYVQTE